MTSPFPDQQPGDGNPTAGESSAVVGGDIEQFEEWFKVAREHRAPWIAEADIDFAFIAGHQWTETDMEVLNDQGRPVITFNRTGAYIDSVSGLEVNNRQEVRYIPRVLGASGPAELATGAAKWARDGCDAEDEESAAFRDNLICGEGWTQTTMSYDDDPDGLVLIEQRDPRQIYPDAGSRKANYADAKRIFYVADMPLADAQAMFPDADDEELDARWARDEADVDTDPVSVPHNAYYRDGMGRGGPSSQRVRIVECEWWEYETVHRVINQVDGKKAHVSVKHFKARAADLKAAGLPAEPVVQDRQKRFYRAILGARVLKQGDGPKRGGFTLKAMTGKRDAKKHCWYGLARPMRDPQMWSNKFLSQYLYMINSNAKGGVMVEVGAMLNKNEFLDSWADPAAVTVVGDGALSGEKIRDKTPPQLPQGVQYLMQFAISSISDVAGSNPEMMGQADRAQAGVVEEHRKQSAMVIYAGMFASLRRYRKEQGRLLLWLLQEFVSDGRLIRIGGSDDMQFVPLMRDKLMGEYDLVVDDTPTSPNMKERTWGAIQALLPIVMKMELAPQMMMALMEESPLPSTLISKLKGMMPPPQQGPSPIQQAEVAERQAAAGLKQAQAQHVMAQAAHATAEAQGLPGVHAIDASEKTARIELLRAQAMAALGTVGLAAHDQRFQQAMQSIDALATVAGAHVDANDAAHGQMMDRVGAVQQAQDSAQQAQQAQQQAAQPGQQGTQQ